MSINKPTTINNKQQTTNKKVQKIHLLGRIAVANNMTFMVVAREWLNSEEK